MKKLGLIITEILTIPLDIIQGLLSLLYLLYSPIFWLKRKCLPPVNLTEEGMKKFWVISDEDREFIKGELYEIRNLMRDKDSNVVYRLADNAIQRLEKEG